MAVKAVACELPRTLELPLSRLFVPDIQKEVIRQGIVASISGSTVWRWLDHDAIRPWTFRSWIFPRDPHFEAKAGVVLDLYARQFEGKALGDNDFVVSADEKTSIQARCRCHPSVPAAHLPTARSERGSSQAWFLLGQGDHALAGSANLGSTRHHIYDFAH